MDTFAALLERVRTGDPQSVEQLLTDYDPYVRRAVRRRLSGLARPLMVDSNDLCQSIFGSLLIRLQNGEYELGSEDDLRKLLGKMAKNKIANWVRRETTDKRGGGFVDLLGSKQSIPDDSALDPARQVALNDVWRAVDERLSVEEKQLANMRRSGLTWEQISEQLNESPTLLRKRLSRALSRVSMELGFQDDSDPI